MSHYLVARARDLGKLLKAQKVQTDPIKAESLENTELKWKLSHLLSKILHEASLRSANNCTRNDIYLLVDQYNREFQTTYTADILFRKFWLREILGQVKIPSAIQYACKTFQNLITAEVELNFLLPHSEKQFPHEELQALANRYNEENGIAISIPQAIAAGLIHGNPTQYSIVDIKRFSPLFAEYREDFTFLQYLMKKFDWSSSYQFEIKKSTLDTLIGRHKNYFTNMPDLNEFLGGEWADYSNEDTVLLSLSNLPEAYPTNVYETCCAELFLLMKEDNHNRIDKGLIKKWIGKASIVSYLTYVPHLLSTDDKNDFLDNVVEILVDESDIDGTEDEYAKANLDSDRTTLEFFNIIAQAHQEKLDEIKDLYVLSNELFRQDSNSYQARFYGQSCRETLETLVNICVANDDDWHAERVMRLFKVAISKPFLLFSLFNSIQYFRPELIPIVAINIETSPIAFLLLKKFQDIQEKQHWKFQSEKANDVLYMFLLVLELLQTKKKEASKVLYQILGGLYQQVLRYSQRENSQISEKALLHCKKQVSEVESALLNFESDTFQYYEGRKIKQYLLPLLLDGIIHELISDENYVPLTRRHIASFPSSNILLCNLIQHSIKNFENSVHSDILKIDRLKSSLAEFFINFYKKSFNLWTVKGWDWQNQAEGDVDISWHANYKFLQNIEWEYHFLLLNGNSSLVRLFREIDIPLPSDDEDFTVTYKKVSRMRAHLFILLTAYHRLVTNLLTNQPNKKNTIVQLENEITSIVELWTAGPNTDPNNDIFKWLHEGAAIGNDQERLLPFVTTCINNFSEGNRQTIYNAILRNDFLERALVILRNCTNEKDRRILIEQLHKLDLNSALEHLTISQVEEVLVESVQYPEFLEIAKEILKYWETESIGRVRVAEREITIFRAKLLIAYFEDNESAIANVLGPNLKKDGTSNRINFSESDTRDFYSGLFDIKKRDFKNAYIKFDNLLQNAKVERPDVAINRFVSHINFACEIKDAEKRDSELRHAIREWDAFVQSIQIGSRKKLLAPLQNNMWYNKMDAYKHIGDNENYLKIYGELSPDLKMQQAFLILHIDFLTQENEYIKAKALLKEAQNYHRMADNSLPQFLQELMEKLENDDDIKQLQAQYRDIVSRSPGSLIKVLSECYNGERDLDRFLLKEVCYAVNNMLDNINAIYEIRLEDKYTDLLMLSLQSQLRPWSWQVLGRRGGFSNPKTVGSTPNPGEIDLCINTSIGERMATMEALILKGQNTNTTLEHIFKTFNYDHRRKLYYILCYYTGNNFMTDWSDYYSNKINSVPYAPGYELLENGIENYSDEYGNDSIKIAKAIHNSGTIIYHLYININYKTTPGVVSVSAAPDTVSKGESNVT